MQSDSLAMWGACRMLASDELPMRHRGSWGEACFPHVVILPVLLCFAIWETGSSFGSRVTRQVSHPPRAGGSISGFATAARPG